MTLRVLLVLTILISASPARSESAISGPGANSCGTFLNLYDQDPGAYGFLFYAWAQGFMSGMNTVAIKVSGQVIDLQPESYLHERQMTYLRTYCEFHPLRSFSEAVFELMTELKNAAPTAPQ